MIQDIAPRHLNNHYDPTITPAPEDFVLCIRQGDLLTGGEDGFPHVRELPEGTPLTYLFAIDEERYFLLQKEDTEL